MGKPGRLHDERVYLYVKIHTHTNLEAIFSAPTEICHLKVHFIYRFQNLQKE